MNAQLIFPAVAGGLVFATALLAISGISGLFGQAEQAERLRAKINGVPGARSRDYLPENARPSLGKAISDRFTDLLNTIGTRLSGKKTEEAATFTSSRARYLQAGWQNPNAPMIFKGLQLVLGLALGGGVFGLPLVAPTLIPQQFLPVAAMGGLAIGYLLPGIWLSQTSAKRKTAIVKEIPDALDLLVVCVEAGMGLDQAINRVSEELKGSAPIICAELRMLNLELRAGMKRADGLKNLALRIGLSDVDSLVALLIQADLFGTSISQTLRVYSDTLRTKRYQRAEEKAAKLPVTMLIPLILFIFPALLMVIVGPAALQLMDMFTQMK
jgi:tight adherence protein C